MSITKVAAIYATGSKLLQRIVVPDYDDKELDRYPPGQGESVVFISIDTYRKTGAIGALEIIGPPTFSGVCAVVDKCTNLVIERIIADPEIYAHPDGHAVIPSDAAMHGDSWDGTQFSRQFAEVDATTGMVVDIYVQPIDALPPAKKNGGPANLLVSSDTLQIGDTVQHIADKYAARGG